VALLPIHLLDVPGGSIAWSWSNGPANHPLVMLHGLGDSAIRTFLPHITPSSLADSPLLLIDLPGFGESRYTPDHPATIASYASDIAMLVRTLGIERFNLFGHSMGGNIAIHLAHHHPDLVSHLVVAEPLLEPSQSILAAGIAEVSEDTFVSRRYQMLVRATSLQAHRGDIAATAFLEPLRMADPVAMHRAARSLVRDAAPLAASTLLNLPVPRTVLVGERTIADTSQFENTDISLVRILNAGHFMLAEAGLATSCAILEAIT
jgi:pimeloyl-ACP methyl ester carboxylesterase